MNILFLSLCAIDNINERGIYSDLMREFVNRGHRVFIASPTERRCGQPTHLIESENCQILRIRTLNIQKTGIVEKGLGNLMLNNQFNRAINKYWKDIDFDLVLYATPPITLNKVIKRIKKRCNCRSYLMLKDIFPQNAVDIGLMKQNGLFHKFFRRKEKELYRISDRIGCMSPANRQYVIRHNPHIDPKKVELCPNSITPLSHSDISPQQRGLVLMKYGIPADKTIFVYGGNLGKPQGVDFLLRVVEANEAESGSHIVIVGGGTEYPKIKHWFESYTPQNASLLSTLPKSEYDALIQVCDVGLIFLDPRFTIPNFPSRLLSYLENRMPVILATDTNTDIGAIVTQNGFGLWCESGDIDQFMANLKLLASDKTAISDMGINGNRFLLRNYTTQTTADIILNEAIPEFHKTNS